jgi:histidine triad (HIT) family protein
MVSTFSHQPPNWECPFCRIVAGETFPDDPSQNADIVYHDDEVTAFLSLHWWGRNSGHTLIVPNAHVENLYVMPDALLGKVAALSKRVALAMKAAYQCDGTSIRQHNEPAGGQDVWHYHLHVVPRYVGDDHYRSKIRRTTLEERQPYAERLRAVLDAQLRAERDTAS